MSSGHTTQWRYYYVKTTPRRRFDVTMTSLSRRVHAGMWSMKYAHGLFGILVIFEILSRFLYSICPINWFADTAATVRRSDGDVSLKISGDVQDFFSFHNLSQVGEYQIPGVGYSENFLTGLCGCGFRPDNFGQGKFGRNIPWPRRISWAWAHFDMILRNFSSHIPLLRKIFQRQTKISSPKC